METIIVKNQKELDAVKEDDDVKIEIRNAEEKIKIKKKYKQPVYVFGSSLVYAYGSSEVHSAGSSEVYSYGSSLVYAYESSEVHSAGSSEVYSYGSSEVHASGLLSITLLDS